MLQNLPEDLQNKLLSLLPQPDLAVLSSSCRALHVLTEPLLARVYRCTTCQHPLFQPRHLRLPVRTDRRRREFFELQDPPLIPDKLSSPIPSSSSTQSLSSLDSSSLTPALALDAHRGAPNFHVLRHLARTEYRNHTGPLRRTDVRAVRALRCPNCIVFVGFRYDGPTTSRHYIHHDFVELVDASSRPVSLSGDLLPDKEGVVRCATPTCSNVLFNRDDVLPWAHVLASSRLTDMDAYLEWDHSWAGPATASHPAFFVKRLRPGVARVVNARDEHLRQGDMTVGDVCCASCDSHIGWKFLAEAPADDADAGQAVLHNYDQVGRFGIIRSAVTPSEPRYHN